ncbi:MAG: hypothetical protein ABSH56_15565 [Bryobacteraceae bacterium]
MAVVFLTVIFIFPVVFDPRIEPPAEVQFGSPFSVAVRISNQNVTPLTNVEYGCEVSKLTLADGSTVRNAKILIRGIMAKIPGRRAITARCESAYVVNAPLKAAEYKLTLTYRSYPWPRQRTNVYRIAARIDGNGQVTGWRLN